MKQYGSNRRKSTDKKGFMATAPTNMHKAYSGEKGCLFSWLLRDEFGFQTIHLIFIKFILWITIMEALGGAASVAQFVLLSLKCVKEAHEAISSFKDGRNILKILERLHQSTSTSDDSALDAHVQQSIQALGSRAVLLVSLQVTPGDSGAKRFWKQLKTVVSDSDVKRIRDELGQLVINYMGYHGWCFHLDLFHNGLAKLLIQGRSFQIAG